MRQKGSEPVPHHTTEVEASRKRRWARAQTEEAEFWQRPGKIARAWALRLPRYEAIFRRLAQQLPEGAVVADVGSGPTCWGQYFPGDHVYLDPLMQSYVGPWGEQRPPGWPIASMGEALPLRDDSVDLVLSLNSIDHCADPALVVREGARIVRPGGLVVIGVYASPPLRAGINRLLERLHLAWNEAHPHAFMPHTVAELMGGAGLEVLEVLDLGPMSKRTRVPALKRRDCMTIARAPQPG